MSDRLEELSPARIGTEGSATVSFWRQLICSSSVFLWLVVLLILLFQPDILSAIVLVPPWCWCVAGTVLAVVGCQKSMWRWSLLAIALWMLFAFVFVDETQGLWRSIARLSNSSSDSDANSDDDAGSVRVISLNCAGDVEAARELISLKPDLVLLQESPGRDQVAQLAKSLFGSSGDFLHKGDTAIVAGGALTDMTPEKVSHFAHARVQLADGFEIDLISLRLSPPVFRMDFWSSGFWNDHRDRRADHRKEIGRLLGQLQNVSTKHSVVVGGDFNTTPIDLTLNDLRSHVFDTFRAVGRGSGNTGTNQYPLFRVDQIWASRDFEAIESRAYASSHSDHRMVISELQLPAKSVE